MREFKNKKRIEHVDLNITALLDMFTMLLIFLLINFSAVSSVLKTSGFLDFPKSSSAKAPVDILSIVVDKYNIIVDDEVVAKHKNGATGSSILEDNGYKIVPLYESLVNYSERTTYIAAVNKKVKAQGKVILQMDKELPFSLLRQIMYTAGQAGYSDFKFIAIKEKIVKK